MIRWLVIVLVVLAAGSIAAALLREDPGYVMLNIGGYTLESTVAAMVAGILFSIAAVILGWRFMRGSVQLPGRVAGYLRERRVAKAQLQFRSGLMRLAAGQWQKAEVELLRRASDQPAPAANYLYAAEAAHELNAPERRDRYLELARSSDPDSETAVLMLHARLLAEEGRNADALVALDQLAGRVSKHPPATELRLELLEKMQNWAALRVALSDASGVIAQDRLDELALRAHGHALAEAARQGKLESLRSAWNQTPKNLKRKAELLAVYAPLLHDLNADSEGLRLIRASMKQNYSGDLVRAYGELHVKDVVGQLATVEEWLKKFGEKPELLLTAGRLCLRNRLWGRARSYFEAGLRVAPAPEFQLELGRLAQQNNDDASAMRHFQHGLELATDHDTDSADKSLGAPPPASALPAPQQAGAGQSADGGSGDDAQVEKA